MNLDSILRSLKRSANRLHQFAWTQFQTRRGTTGAVNEKGKRRYGKEAERILRGGQADEEDTIIHGEPMDESEVAPKRTPKQRRDDWFEPETPKPANQPMPAPVGDATDHVGRTVASQLQKISDQFKALSYDQIESEVRKLKNIDIGSLKEAAKQFGLHTGLTSRKAIIDKIVAKIHDRKEKSERGDRIAVEAEISEGRNRG